MVGSAGIERETAVGEDGLDQADLAVDGDPRIGRAEEAEDGVVAVVKHRGRKREGRIVGSLQPELEHDGRPVERFVTRVRRQAGG